MTQLASILDCAIAGSPCAGETISGDRAVLAEFTDGALIAVIDGLGHGAEAAHAAQAAAELLEAHPSDAPLELVRRCHDALRRTRGVALSLAAIDARRSTMSWIGVGNVEGTLLRVGRGELPARESLSTRGGVVGSHLPPLRTHELSIAPGDTLLFTSDGIRGGFHDTIELGASPTQQAESIAATFGKREDDSCVVVARYLGLPLLAERVLVREEADIAMVRKALREQARAAGVDEAAIERLATAASELARNVLVHACGGEIFVGPTRAGERRAFLVVARDEGPGIAEPARALEDGYSTAGGLGLGLPGARRLVDELELQTTVGRGTTVTLRRWLS